MSFTNLPNGAAVQKRLWQGYGKVAKQQGQVTGVYRPIDPLHPFDNMVSTIPVVYTNNYGFIKPDKFGINWLYGIFDGTGIQEGDYLVTPPFTNNPEGNDPSVVFSNTGIPDRCDVFYVCSMDTNVPILLFECQRTITVSRILGPQGVNGGTKGVLGYSGAIPGGEQNLMANYRASILQGTKGETNPANLPLDIRMPWWTITFPSFSGIVLDTGDVIRDDLGRRYMISSAELSDLGWRVTAAYERA